MHSKGCLIARTGYITSPPLFEFASDVRVIRILLKERNSSSISDKYSVYQSIKTGTPIREARRPFRGGILLAHDIYATSESTLVIQAGLRSQDPLPIAHIYPSCRMYGRTAKEGRRLVGLIRLGR